MQRIYVKIPNAIGIRKRTKGGTWIYRKTIKIIIVKIDPDISPSLLPLDLNSILFSSRESKIGMRLSNNLSNSAIMN
ncbi:MAG: hypothetical protein Q4F97_08375 [Bacteroidales bacterium]|nr:hypothetical protein [Bacteroidales bacterium]